MKRGVLLGFIVLATLVVTCLVIRGRTPHALSDRKGSGQGHPVGSTVSPRSDAETSPQIQQHSVGAEEEYPAYWKDSGILFADWKDHTEWRQTPEYNSMITELTSITQAAEKRGDLTSNEVERLIAYMYSPHFAARNLAAAAARVAGSEATSSALLPHVLYLSTDSVPLVRLAAAHTLGKIGDETTISQLESMLNDRELIARMAVNAISNLQQRAHGQR